jgi:hypothetical protein
MLIQGNRKHDLESLAAQEGTATLKGDFTVQTLDGDILNKNAPLFFNGQGSLINEGEAAIQQGDVSGDITNQHSLNVKTATVSGALHNSKDGVVTVEESLNADTIKNAGQIQGATYTLSSPVVDNTGTLLGEKKITLQAETLTQHGRLQAPVMDFKGVQQIIDTKDSVWAGETIMTQLHHNWTTLAVFFVDTWADESLGTVNLINGGTWSIQKGFSTQRADVLWQRL